MRTLKLRKAVQEYDGAAWKALSSGGTLSVRNHLFGGSYVGTASLRKRLGGSLGEVWGVADLHAHPMANYGFGAEPDGQGGIIWGQPCEHRDDGQDYRDTDISVDVQHCDSHIHSKDVGPARMIARKIILDMLETEGHGFYGHPAFTDWPSARSPTHQQMHLRWLHRAWQGGLRLIVASAVDNQVLEQLWHADLGSIGNIWNVATGGSFPTTPNFDFISATEQLGRIIKVAEANASWMRVVRSSAEARDAIESDKLAVVLAVEMDQLTADDIVGLRHGFGVRLATPVHIVDNDFGGAAIYKELFVLANWALNDELFQTIERDDVEYRLTPSSDPDAPGHRNKKGLLSKPALRKLMKAGLLIDVAHMSQRCIDDVLEEAEAHDYPLVNTHTGLRTDLDKHDPERSERDLLRAHATRIAGLKGIVGLGTASKDPTEPMGDWLAHYRRMSDAALGMPVALGTDLNGLDIRIHESEEAITYTFPTPCPDIGDHGSVAMNPVPPSLGPFDFPNKGLAHVGLLPEFLHTVAKLDDNGWAVHRLFSSAEAFVKTWEDVEAAQARIV